MNFISVDASTQSMAYAIWDTELRAWGKILYGSNSKNVYDKAGTIGKKSGALTRALLERFEVKVMVIEKPIFANSPMTASNLALTQGALVGAAIFGGIGRVVGTEPITWQSWVGNPNLKKVEKETINAEYPGKSATFLKQKQREFRKQRTIDYVNKRFDVGVYDNDVADAIGIGCWYIDKGMLQ